MHRLNKILVLYSFFLLLLGLISCKTYENIDIQLLYPSPVEIPDNIQSLTIMNRSLTPGFSNKNPDTLQVEFYQLGFEVDTVLLDSTASDLTIRSLSDLLFDSERFDVVIPVDRNIPRALRSDLMPGPLSWDYVEVLCMEYNTDALVVLENFSTHVVTGFQRSYEYDQEGNRYSAYYASEDVSYRSYWRIYDPGTKTILFDRFLTDTIYWDAYDYTQQNLFAGMPKVKEAIINSGYVAAEDFSKLIAPQWKGAKRVFFSKGKALEEGANFALAGEWEKAEESWLNSIDTDNKMLRSKLEINIALAREMQGDIDGAIEWGLKSYYSYFRTQTNDYLRVLDERKKLLKELEDE